MVKDSISSNKKTSGNFTQSILNRTELTPAEVGSKGWSGQN